MKEGKQIKGRAPKFTESLIRTARMEAGRMAE